MNEAKRSAAAFVRDETLFADTLQKRASETWADAGARVLRSSRKLPKVTLDVARMAVGIDISKSREAAEIVRAAAKHIRNSKN